MDSIVRTIVDMDKRARERTKEDREYIEKIDAEISIEAEKMQQEHQERARKVIEENERANRKKINEELRELDRRATEISEHLDDLYEQKGEEWAEALAARAIAD